jgi:hypothetical protein
MHSDLNDLVIYQHPGGVRRYYLNALHQVFGFGTVQMVGYIEGFDVFDVDGTPTHRIEGFMPLFRVRAELKWAWPPR